MISPLAVTLKRFFALEFVFTFGILNNLLRLHPAGVPGTSRKTCFDLTGKIGLQNYVFFFIYTIL